jgi:hypothetical protein
MSDSLGKKSRWNIYSISIEFFFEILYSKPPINLSFSTDLTDPENIGKNSSEERYGFTGNDGIS